MSLTKRMMELDDELPEVDPAAFSDHDTCEVDDDWLRAATPEEQSAAMRHWLMARYCDPAMETPYDAEAGYIYTRGGPWDPHDVLAERFEGIADFDTIEELVVDILGEIGDELAPTALTAVDDEWDVEVETADSPIRDLERRVADLSLVLAMEGGERAEFQARNLVFAALITALETFLWETAVWWLAKDDESVPRLIAALPAFTDGRLRGMVGGEPFELAERRQKIHDGMKDMVWHRWRSNWPFLAALLNVEMPCHDDYGLTQASLKRHDIVHRAGQNKDRTETVYATTADVEALKGTVLALAQDLESRIAARGL